MAPRGHLILGAGCAGLGLAVALLDEGMREEIVLVDARRSFGRDRTWCLWDVGSTPLTRLATHRWPSWEVRGADGRTAVQTSQRHPYVHLDARDVYAAALERLDRAPNVTLRLGERVLDHGEDDDRAWAQTARGLLEAAWVHDALGAGSPGLDLGQVEVWQTFLGQEVEVDAPVFDPGRATLMDFGVAQRGGVRFTYVLPFSRTRALVEDTSIAPADLPVDVRRAAVAGHLTSRYGVRAFTVLREERGRLPMAVGLGAGVGSRSPGRRSTRVGLAGGAVRPSSGYAFARIQTDVRRLARALARDGTPPARAGGRRAEALDALFLRGLAARPQDFPDHFLALAHRVSGDVFARFLSDASSPLDEARIVAALASPGFLAAGLRGR